MCQAQVCKLSGVDYEWHDTATVLLLPDTLVFCNNMRTLHADERMSSAEVLQNTSIDKTNSK